MSKSVILGFTFLVSGRALSFMTRGLQLIPNSAALTPRGIVTLIEFFRFFSSMFFNFISVYLMLLLVYGILIPPVRDG